MKPFLYAGPTLYRAADAPIDRVTVLPPIRRGDLPRLVRDHPAGIAIIADGVFHASLAVGHAEIRDALAGGWRVIGVSSIGAIRAAEMRGHGMEGYGEVFQRYCGDDDFRDDEVTLLHESEPPYRELCEPLIHLRRLLADLMKQGVITAAEHEQLIDELAGMWFGDRTLAFVAARLARPDRGQAIAEAIRDIDRHRVKVHDLVGLLNDLDG